MKTTNIQWIALGLTAAYLSGATLVGCTQTPEADVKTPAKEEAAVAHDAHAEHAADDDHHAMDTLAVEKRVAFMSGHVAAGLALYRAGAPDQAAKHLLHPVSETHQAERAGIDALGFQADIFQAVSKALDEGKPAAEVEPMLKAAEENIGLLQTNAGGDLTDIINFLMETVVEEYTIGVKDGVITDAGEYQDAYGFSVVALKIAARIEGPAGKAATEQLTSLVALWPTTGPLADATPTPVATVVAQTALVTGALAN